MSVPTWRPLTKDRVDVAPFEAVPDGHGGRAGIPAVWSAPADLLAGVGGHMAGTHLRRRRTWAAISVLVTALLAAVLTAVPASAAPGSLDPAYGTSGTASTPPTPANWTSGSMPLQTAVTQSGAVWAIEVAIGISPEYRLTRVAPGGTSSASMSLDDYASPAAPSVAVIGETAMVGAGGTSSTGFLLRVRPDLTLDPTFAGDGVMSVAAGDFASLGGDVNLFGNVAPGPAGSLLASAVWTEVDGPVTGVIRVLPEGTPDLTFGVAGRSTGEFALEGMTATMPLATDGMGRILTSIHDEVRRYTAAGVADPSFSADGRVSLAETVDGAWRCGAGIAAACEVLERPDGSVVVAGAVPTSTSFGQIDVPTLAVVAPDGGTVTAVPTCAPDPPNQVPGCGDISAMFTAVTAGGPRLHILSGSSLVTLPSPLPSSSPEPASLLDGSVETALPLIAFSAAAGEEPGVAYIGGLEAGPGGFAARVGRVLLDVEPTPPSVSISPPSGEVEIGEPLVVDITCEQTAYCQAFAVDGEVPDPAPSGWIGAWDPPVTYAELADGGSIDTSVAGVKTVIVLATPSLATAPYVMARARYEIVDGGPDPTTTPPTFAPPTEPGPPTPSACPSPPAAAIVPAPRGITDLREDQYEADNCVFVFAERSGIVLDETGIEVTTPASAGNMVRETSATATLRNRVVDSYLVRGDRFTAAGASLVSGTYRFSKPILGVVSRTATLDATDPLVSLGVTRYNAGVGNRGLEVGGLQTVDDSVRVNGNTLTLTMQFSGQTDEVRVFTGNLADGGIEQSILFPALPVGPRVGTSVNLAATATSGLAVGYTASGGCAVAGTRLTFTGVDACIVTAVQNGNALWSPAVPVDRSTAALRGSQTITFPSPTGNPAVGVPVSLSATTTSRLPVAFSTSGPCTTSGADGAEITMTGPGSCSITASQAGDANWAPATPVVRALTSKSDQTITFGTLSDAPEAGATIILAAAASSSLPVTYVASGACTLANQNRLTFTRASECVVTATQVGNASWNPAPPRQPERHGGAGRPDHQVHRGLHPSPHRLVVHGVRFGELGAPGHLFRHGGVHRIRSPRRHHHHHHVGNLRGHGVTGRLRRLPTGARRGPEHPHPDGSGDHLPGPARRPGGRIRRDPGGVRHLRAGRHLLGVGRVSRHLQPAVVRVGGRMSCYRLPGRQHPLESGHTGQPVDLCDLR